MRDRAPSLVRGLLRTGGMMMVAGVASAASALSPPTPAPTPHAVIDACGDADGDGFLGVTDGVQARSVRRPAFRAPVPTFAATSTAAAPSP